MSHFAYKILPLTLAACLLGSTAHAQITPSDNSAKLFSGCVDTQVIPRPKNDDPRDRMYDAAKKVDPITSRVFKSFKLEEVAEAGGDEFDGLCWSRIDGLWQEQMAVGFDSSVKAKGWAGLKSGMDEFAHGTYTTPVLVVVDVDNDYREIRLRSALGSGRTIRFTSNDNVTIENIVDDPGLPKIYRSEAVNGQTQTLRLSISSKGHMRIKIGDREFRRPRPEISKYDRGEQVPASDLFAIAYNPKNMRANRQGYDVTTQNPDRFLRNDGKLNVFAEAKPRDYYISEQLTVPMGLKLVEEGAQGTVFFERLLSSESEYQQASSSSFGVNVGLSNEKALKGLEAAGKAPPGTADAGKKSASVGYKNAKEETEGMKSQNSVASMNGFQRYKKYALVRDHAFSELSDDFYDAIEDAYRSGEYQKLIIDKFGTHYGYATTFGAAGRLQTYMTEETISNNASSFESENTSGGLEIGPLDFSVTKDSASSLTSSNSTTNKFGKTVFTGVGGNGSWDQNGFVAGDTPYPILMDLRSIDELLNPIYFPDRPEIYNKARTELSAAIASYLYGKAQLVSTESLLDGIEPMQTMVIKLTGLQCLKAGAWEGKGNPVQVEAIINLKFPASRAVFGKDVHAYNTKKDTKDGYTVINCPGGTRKISGKKTARRFKGKASQLKAARWEIHTRLEEWDWGFDGLDGAEIIRTAPKLGLRVPVLKVGQGYNVHWDVPPNKAGMPKLRITVRFTREK